MVVEIIVDIICARDADINSIINGDITEELYAWDLDYSKTDGQYYFKAKRQRHQATKQKRLWRYADYRARGTPQNG